MNRTGTGTTVYLGPTIYALFVSNARVVQGGGECHKACWTHLGLIQSSEEMMIIPMSNQVTPWWGMRKKDRSLQQALVLWSTVVLFNSNENKQGNFQARPPLLRAFYKHGRAHGKHVDCFVIVIEVKGWYKICQFFKNKWPKKVVWNKFKEI